jgi:hypothetical protein
MLYAGYHFFEVLSSFHFHPYCSFPAIPTTLPGISALRLLGHLPPQLGELPLDLYPLREQLPASRLQGVDPVFDGCFDQLLLLLL